MESQLYAHYAWAPYWGPGYAYAGAVPTAGLARGPAATARTGDPRATETSGREMSKGDPHLRSVGEVTGYYIHARDDGIGHVEEFLIEDESWKVRYLVIDTKNWWPGKMVLVSPQWIKEIRWSNRQVFVDLTREQVRNSPEYDPMTTLGRDYERRLFGHYGSTPYWA
jgi:hypothetical protein